ncbi:MAG: site-specific integrase [Devosia sp.]|uniref:site-specific integrase n=1 Tax=Devosia sp. TaxID=1871048 RepID=UPI001A021D6A|nr:site-specific integrase [Devosia sp.]MBF0678074.1 site-specific integrase [Devosia sp.]
MAAKCAYVEKVGAVYYVRKRIPRAWNRQAEGEVVRLSLRTKDRATALKWGLEALAVFEELLGMEPKDALMQLTRRLINEQLLRPEDMTGTDLVRRRALGNVGAKIIRRARRELQLGENLNAIYEELVHFNRATVEGEAIYDRMPQEEKARRGAASRVIDLSGFNAVLDDLGAKTDETLSEEAPTARAPISPASPKPMPLAESTAEKASASTVYTLRYLMDDYFRKGGKTTGSDNRANVERAVKLFEDLCPEVKVLPVMDIGLDLWDQLYDFVQEIPLLRGRASPDDLVVFTRRLQAKGGDYPRLAIRTLNSNYLGAITRLVKHGNKRRLFTWQAPPMVVAEGKRATKSKAKAPFSPGEITAITSCAVYLGSASRRHRYSSGTNVYADDHVYWAPLVAMHLGMRVTEIGLLRLAQLQSWFGQPTLVLELDGINDDAVGEEGYKTGNAIRRVPLHPQLIELGFLDYWQRQLEAGHNRLFPAWTQHIKGGKDDRPEVHFEADFFNAHRLKWGVPKHRKDKLTFHSFRGFFIQACHDARINPYTILKWVGHDEETAARTNEVHRNYLSHDLTEEEVAEIAKVKVPIGSVVSYKERFRDHG